MAYSNIPTAKIAATIPMLVVSFDVFAVLDRITSGYDVF
jgi:hypothetical protein